jgi:hypothetical protein
VLDPSTRATGAVTAKMGIDATKPMDAGRGFEKARIPRVDEIDLAEYLTDTRATA